MSKISTQTFIEKARRVYGDTFDYSLVEYKGSKLKVIIKCKEHGEFLQTPSGHLCGYGCKKCSNLRKSLKTRYSLETFISKAHEVHNYKYSYAKAYYVSSRDHVTITCHQHGDFLQIPVNHLGGQGCPLCGNIKTGNSIRKDTDYFIKRAKEVHGDLYDYSPTNYIDSKTKVIIRCKTHGNFRQNPTAHISCAANCPKCKPSGYVATLPGYLYIASNSFLTKIGITNKSPSSRILDVNRSGKLNFDLDEIFYFEDGNIALETETKVLQILNKHYEKCKTHFNGNSECFYELPTSIATSIVVRELLTDKGIK